MAIITRAQLRKWFGRGQYPTAEQFSGLFDSFWHKEEDKIAVTAVEGLAEQLNGKMSAADGQALQETVEQVAAQFAAYRTEADEAIEQLREQLDNLRSVVEKECVQRSTRVILDAGAPADLLNNNNENSI